MLDGPRVFNVDCFHSKLKIKKVETQEHFACMKT